MKRTTSVHDGRTEWKRRPDAVDADADADADAVERAVEDAVDEIRAVDDGYPR